MARKKKEEPHANHERWLITYADLITLLMIFFIVMYSMGRVDMAKYAAMAKSLSMVLQGQNAAILDSPGPAIIEGLSGKDLDDRQVAEAAEQMKLEEVKQMIEEFLQQQETEAFSGKQGEQIVTKLSDYVSIMEQERGLVISFKDALLFSSGSDEINPAAAEVIKQIGLTLVNIPNYIRVEGHTDNLPINTAKFPSNWELSALRASNVVHILQSQAKIPPERLSIIGYGEYRPIAANEDEKSRAMNRRVDIVILKKKYDYFEPVNAPSPVITGNSATAH